MVRVLIVEDERKLLRSLERGLQAEGYETLGVVSGATGLQLAQSQPIDCAILDILLPGKNGLDVLRDLRSSGSLLPVLLLTARDSVDDRVVGLDAGADDYLVKPFAFVELLARVRVLLRRERADRGTILRCGDLEMDLLQREVTLNGAPVQLTAREFALLDYLLRHQNTAVSRAMIGQDVWNEPDYALTNVIDVHINALRKKLDRNGRGSMIQTVRGVGYSLHANDEGRVPERNGPCA